MKKRYLSLALIFTLIASLTLPFAARAASIDIGCYVQMGTYYGQPILWRCVDIDENGPLMLADKIICIKPFDADGGANTSTGSHSRNEDRQSSGSNYWADSNMRSWLNSGEGAGNVNWLCGNPPDEAHVRRGNNDYDAEAGFLTNFTQAELNAVKEVSQKSLLAYPEADAGMAQTGSEIHLFSYDNGTAAAAANYDSAYAEYITDKIFLLDVKQLNSVYENGNILGVDYYIGEPTAECVSGSEYKNRDFEFGKKWSYWLRSPRADYTGGVRYVSDTGSVSFDQSDDYSVGVRPAFYLDIQSVSFSSGSGSAQSPYIIGEPGDTTVTSYNSEVSQWSSPEMEEAYSVGLIPENLVGENLTKPVSRAEFAAISVKLYESLVGSSASGVNTPFVDIGSNKNKTDIEKAYALNIAIGVSDSEFAPDDGLTREQLATMLCRTIKKYKFEGWSTETDSEYYLDSEGVKKFADDDLISDYAKPSVYYMVKMGIIKGIDENHFAPRNTTAEEEAEGYASATREQAIALSLRTYKLSDLWK